MSYPYHPYGTQHTVLVCGSRTCNNTKLVESKLDAILSNLGHHNCLILEGGALGADRLARIWAVKRGVETKVERADWAKHGKSAGFKRNKVMIDQASHVIAFWDGESRGTEHTIHLAKANNLPLRIVKTS